MPKRTLRRVFFYVFILQFQNVFNGAIVAVETDIIPNKQSNIERAGKQSQYFQRSVMYRYQRGCALQKLYKASYKCPSQLVSNIALSEVAKHPFRLSF